MKTNRSQTIMDKLESLPEELQQEVLDYIDFLLQKYQIEPSDSSQTSKKQKDRSANQQPQKLEFW